MPLYGHGNQRPRHRRREARTASRVEGAESPEVVEERLKSCRIAEVRDERRVVEHAGDASPSVISYFARRGSALAMLSRFFSSIAVTEFSFSSVGANLLFVVVHQSGQLLGHRGRVGQQVDDLLPRAPPGLASRSSALRMSLLTCWLRSDRIPVTSLALLSRSPRVLLRPLRVCDSRVSPSKVGPNCGAIWLIVSDSVSSDWFSDRGVWFRRYWW